MSRSPVSLTKQEAARAWVRYQVATGSLDEVLARLRSVQFDPLAPVGCNHDLVLQARVPEYKIGDWQDATYKDRVLYDGWDKQACLIPFSGYPSRRIFHQWHRAWFNRIWNDHPHAVDAVLAELEARGPLLPKEFEFQEHRAEWKGSWFGPNLTKQVLRALWHTGRVMTSRRKGLHHIYDLAERVVPPSHFSAPEMSERESLRELLKDRHEGVGMLRPNAPYEVWSMPTNAATRRSVIDDLLAEGVLVSVDIEGVRVNATPDFLAMVGQPVDGRACVLGPLDNLLWDRKLVAHVFGFDYLWEVYKPEALRKWGYYVLPVLVGDRFVARFDAMCRGGELRILSWHWEDGQGPSDELAAGLAEFMSYAGATKIVCETGVGKPVRSLARQAVKVRKAR